MKINTVNVVEMTDDYTMSINSFEDNEDGNKEANSMFTKCALENGCSNEDVDSFIEDGYFEQGTYQLFIIHSS